MIREIMKSWTKALTVGLENSGQLLELFKRQTQPELDGCKE